jgi:hypothetical protein
MEVVVLRHINCRRLYDLNLLIASLNKSGFFKMGAWDKLFWALFALGGVSLAFSIYFDPAISATAGLLTGMTIIATGAVKLADEVAFKELKEVNERLVDALYWIKEGLNKLGTGGAIEDDEQHTMLAKKILELENRVNRVSKALTEEIVDIKNRQGSDFVEIKDDAEKHAKEANEAI